MHCGKKKMNKGGGVEACTSRGPTTRRRANRKSESIPEIINDEVDVRTLNDLYKKRMGEPKYAEGGEVNTDEMSFGKAFRHFRNAGDKTFTWKGKKYTTELAKPEAPKAKPKTPTATRVESAQESMRTGKPMTDSGFTSVRKPSSGPTTRGGARRPAPVSTRRSEGVSRREFGQNLKGPKYSADDIKTAERAATAMGAAMSVAPGAGVAMRGARGLAAADAAAAAAARKKAAEEAAKVTKELERRRRTMTGSNVGGQGNRPAINRREGGSIKKYAAGGAVTRGDGISRVKTRCRIR